MDSSILVWWNVIKAMEVCPLYSVAAILLKIITKIYERNSYWAKDPYELKIYYQYDCSSRKTVWNLECEWAEE